MAHGPFTKKFKAHPSIPHFLGGGWPAAWWAKLYTPPQGAAS